MHIATFFSVHEDWMNPLLCELRDGWRVDRFSGFVWGRDQSKRLSSSQIRYEPLTIWSRDILPRARNSKPDMGFLRDREHRYGVPVTRMVHAERHLRRGRSYEEVLSLAEATFRVVEETWSADRPDAVFSEDISCLTSYVHWAVARGMGIPFWIIGSARIPNRVMVYVDGLQQWNFMEERHRELEKRGLSADEREEAERFVTEFRVKRERPTGEARRAAFRAVSDADFSGFSRVVEDWIGDRDNPTGSSPVRAIFNRTQRVVRETRSRMESLFEMPRPGEQFVLFPLHVQPEASTLVQAPMYLNQVALIEDIAKCLPAGVRLYVKEHVSSRGRRPISTYRALRRVHGVRLISPHADSWELVRTAQAVVVITGTMGWEALLFERPVVSFGNVFFRTCPLVHDGSRLPKDGWPELFDMAIRQGRPDQEALLRFVSAMLRTSHPGFIGNYRKIPEVADPSNIRNLAMALANRMNLTPRGSSSGGP